MVTMATKFLGCVGNARLLESLAQAAQAAHPSRGAQQSEFEQGRRQVAVFVARVA
jgi:hypothetical protein